MASVSIPLMMRTSWAMVIHCIPRSSRPWHDSLVGPADLGMSMVGVEPAEKARITEQVQRRVGELARQHGKFAGSCAGPTKASCQGLMERGIQWMTIAQDVRIISGMLTEAIRDIHG